MKSPIQLTMIVAGCLAIVLLVIVLVSRTTLSHNPGLELVSIRNDSNHKLGFWIDTDNPEWVGPKSTLEPPESFVVKPYDRVKVVDAAGTDVGAARILPKVGDRVLISFP